MGNSQGYLSRIISDEEYRSAAHDSASGAIFRSRRIRSPFLGITAYRRNIISAYRQMQRDGVFAFALFDTIRENHYVINKAQAQLTYTAKLMRRERFTLQRRGREKAQIRIYALCERMLGEKAYRLDYSSLKTFTDAYQEVTSLDEGEIALIPLCLRILCVKCAADIYAQAKEIAEDIKSAGKIAEKAASMQSSRSKDVLISTEVPHLSDAGIAALYSLFSDNDDFYCIERLGEALKKQNTDIRTVSLNDRERQSRLSELTVNIAGTIRFTDSLSTEKLLSDFSQLEKILSQDETYSHMDEASKRAYSVTCMRIAAKLSVSQSYVAKTAKEAGDVNYFLGSREGTHELMKLMGLHTHRMNTNAKLALHISLQLLFTAGIVLLCAKKGFVPALISVLPAYVLVNSVFMRITSQLTKPVSVPRMKIEKISPEKTVTAVSVLVTDENTLNSALEQLETHYLSANLRNTYYAVLGDFPDAKADGETDDEKALASLAAEKTRALNRKYGRDGDVFCFLLRKRKRNEADGIYMGYERKRGAVMQFFDLVKNDRGRTDYSVIEGVLPQGIKYALLLDSDTVLPKGALSQLIGAALHPQNRAVIKSGRIIRGYGIFIPRMERESRSHTGFMRTHNGTGGVSPYSSLVCDFYHDNYGEAIFGGKGLIDITAFLECMQGRVEDNTVLSHDMLESSFVRSAYVSDVVLYDSEPKTLISWWKRAHRWIRGDWQLIPYLFAKKGSRRYVNALTKWKIIDNIRRSVTPFAVLQSILVLPYYGIGLYVLLSLVCAFSEAFTDSVTSVWQYARYGRASVRETGLTWEKSFVDFMSLPYAAARTVDAIWRALHRMLFSHKKMLEWQTAAQSEKVLNKKPLLYYAQLWACFWTGIRLLILPLFGLHGSVVIGVFFVYAPFALRIYDTPFTEKPLSDEHKAYCHNLARDIWEFFCAYGKRESGFIPPDNVQCYPAMPPVYNASPTNIGMGLMAAVCAYELDFIDADELTDRLCVTNSYLKKLDKWNGHFYNWYDIKSGEKLTPAYVSTVDSGNLCAALLVCSSVLSDIGTEKAKECAEDFREILENTDFAALFDAEKNLFYIGMDVTRCAMTQSRYDLLASEARLTYLIACAFDKIPQKSWNALSRVLTKTKDGRTLCSWSGTMFEYLMPVIFTGITADTLTDECVRGCIDEHIACADGKPWGISESGYYAFDRNMYYQYRAFGAESIGLCPTYSYEDVRAPYATVLAGQVMPEKALSNLADFEETGARGRYGFYEAVDYTAQRVQAGKRCEIVKSYMAHHQGMSICSLTNMLKDNVLSEIFMSCPEIRTVRLYNDEKIPDDMLILENPERIILRDDGQRARRTPHTYANGARYPRGAFLTNGKMSVFLSDSGISSVRVNDTFLTRYRRDYVRGKYGLYLYLRDGEKVFCINTTDADADDAKMRFTFESYRALTELVTDELSVETESIVLQSSNTLCIKIKIANMSGLSKSLELGAFADIAIANLSEDMSHSSFVDLTTDAVRTGRGLMLRRKGTKSRPDMYVYVQFSDGNGVYMSADGKTLGRHSDYCSFMRSDMYKNGRIKSPQSPHVIIRNELLSGAGEGTEILFTLTFGKSRENVLSCANAVIDADFSQMRSLCFAMDMSALKAMGISEGKAETFSRIAARIASGAGNNKLLNTRPTLCRDVLFKYSISGELPIMTAEISNPTHYRMLKTLLSLLKYCSYKGAAFDLVIIGRYDMSYRCDTKSYITDTVATGMIGSCYGENERVHIIDGFNLSDDEYALLLCCSDFVTDCSRSLDKQFQDEPCPVRKEISADKYDVSDNKGFSGAFSGDEYVIKLPHCADTPLPWSNIITNPQNEQFGTLTTESGGGYTWSGNAHENRLTPWHCDILHDTQGEMLLITDERGRMRTVSHSRIQGENDVTVRYGYGYTVYENNSGGINAKLTVFTDTDHPQKISLLSLENTSGRQEKLTLQYIIDRESRAFTEFSDSLGLLFSPQTGTLTYISVQNADSLRFSGDREGTLLMYEQRENVNSQGFMCIDADVFLRPHEIRSIILLLGTAENKNTALAHTLSVTVQSAREKLRAIKSAWAQKLGGISVETDNAAFDTMVNGRLLYQVYSSRLFGRTGFYQSGGAIGFRDQLQDVLSLLYTDAERAKGQILLCASVQYEKGDCLHWWHTPDMHGVRTKITDDRLFLPYVCAQYIKVTGDMSILDIRMPYLCDEPLSSDSLYYHAKHSQRDGSIYEHCMKSFYVSAQFGAHGLPLMGSGDWNDGMDNVGEGGGESVFLAFFILCATEKFLPLCARKNDNEGAAFLRELTIKLRAAVDKYAWDGAWYRRGFYADGTPLGSRENSECKIDLLSQVWAVFADYKRTPDRCRQAYRSAKELLLDENAGIVKLLTPPFSDGGEHYAGYIESYCEGVRENGGQYTHAAAWFLAAACVMGENEDAMRIFDMLNPANKNTSTYMAEPYALAADVYSCEGAEGMGGWTWYSGSAGWLYTAAVKYVIGMVKKGDTVYFEPHNTWKRYTVTYRYGSSTYVFNVKNDKCNRSREIVLTDDGKRHEESVGC